jgi:hypothetical protein
MISLCIGTNLNQLEWLKILLKSVKANATLINDIQVTLNDFDGHDKYGMVEIRGNNVKIKKDEQNSMMIRHWTSLSYSIENAKNDLVLMSDVDIFLKYKADEVFYNLMQKYNLDIIGVSHYMGYAQACKILPNVIFTLVRRSVLAEQPAYLDAPILRHFLKTDLDKVKFKNLSPFCIESEKSRYPNPDGHFETGSSLALYIKDKKLNWLSFQTPDVHNYSTQYWRSNLKIKDKVEKVQLIYHQTGSVMHQYSVQNLKQIDVFKEEFNKYNYVKF